MAEKKQKQSKQLMVVKEAFAVMSKDGTPRMITDETPLWSNDPVVKKHPDLFEPLADRVARRVPVVHTATAVPGEVRAAELPDDPSEFLEKLAADESKSRSCDPSEEDCTCE